MLSAIPVASGLTLKKRKGFLFIAFVEAIMKKVKIVSKDGAGMMFEKEHVREACNKMICGEHADECIRLMEKRAMECVLCFAVLTALKKPFKKRVSRNRKTRSA
jgi:hypothetical protein